MLVYEKLREKNYFNHELFVGAIANVMLNKLYGDWKNGEYGTIDFWDLVILCQDQLNDQIESAFMEAALTMTEERGIK